MLTQLQEQIMIVLDDAKYERGKFVSLLVERLQKPEREIKLAIYDLIVILQQRAEILKSEVEV